MTAAQWCTDARPCLLLTDSRHVTRPYREVRFPADEGDCSRANWKRTGLAVGVVLLYGILFEFWMFAVPASSSFKNGVEDIADTAAPALAVLLCFRWLGRVSGSAGPKRPWRNRLFDAPFMLAAGVVSYSSGSLVWDYYDLVLHQPPFPSWADALYLTTDPILLMGVLFLPVRRLSRVSRLRLSVDSVLGMAAMITLSWYFVLGPTLLSGSDSPFERAVGAAYPVCDLLLVLCLILLTVRIRHIGLRRDLVVLILAMGLLVIVDSAFSLETLHGTYDYSGGNVVDAGWSVGYALVAVAAASLRAPLAALAQSPVFPDNPADVAFSPPSPWRPLLVNGLVPAVAVLLVSVTLRGASLPLKVGVYISGIGLLLLVYGQHIILLVENSALRRRLDDLEATVRVRSRLDEVASLGTMPPWPGPEAMRSRAGRTASAEQPGQADGVYRVKPRVYGDENAAGRRRTIRMYDNVSYYWILGVSPDAAPAEI